jgi:predicted DNA-binding antitoxin AbrB/MazE fold protein
MIDRVEAIYENGVFKPLGDVALPDRLRVVLRIENGDATAVDAEAQVVARQKRAMESLDAELEHVPDNSPDDGRSSATHERILYGDSP